MGKKSRNKGAAYERYVADLFRVAGWETAKRHLEFQSDEAEAGRDLDNTQPFAVQCKCWKSAPPITSILQIKPDEEYPIPMAMLKRTQSKGKPMLEVAVVPLEIMMYILKLLKEHGMLRSICPFGAEDEWSAS